MGYFMPGRTDDEPYMIWVETPKMSNPTINGANPLPEASQVGTYSPRPTPTGSTGGGPQGGLGKGK